MDNKFYKEGFNKASEGIQQYMQFTQNYQGKAGVDFQVPDLSQNNRDEFIKGYEDHYRQAFQSDTQIQLYFGISN